MKPIANDQAQPQQTDTKARKRYEPPRIVETASFEGLALGCGQYSAVCGASQFNPS